MPIFEKHSKLIGSSQAATRETEGESFFGGQAKLSMGSKNNAYEREADKAADHVVNQSNGGGSFFGSGSYGSTGKPQIQQKSSNQFIQRSLAVREDYPQDYIDRFQTDPKGEDPSKSLSNKERVDLVKGQLAKISPDFTVKANGKVAPSHSKSEADLAKGGKGTGSCCMHVLTRPTAQFDWKILVGDHLFPHTHDKKHKVFINSNLAPLEAGYHTKKGEKKTYTANPEVVLGHELCGHAALEDLGAHAKGKRAVSTLHDSTVNIENEIARSVGIKEDDLRGLAGDGPHKGESFGQSTVIDFGFNKASVYKLDPAERDKLKLIADLVKVFDMFVEIRGHSDNVGSAVAKQHISDRRAKNVYHYLRKQGVSRRAKVEIAEKKKIGVNRFLLKGMSDKEPVPGFDPKTEQHKLRRVEVIVASYPAGLSELPPGVPKWKKNILARHDKVNEPKKVQEYVDKGTPCEKLLVEKAFRKK
ncbi:MAG: OmpA family protein [Bacteroidota bacterium]